MEFPHNANLRIPVLLVLYDFRYLWKDNREVFVKKGEKLLLIEKTNKDWWQVVRPTEKKSFFVPAQYVEVLENEKSGKNIAGTSSGADGDDSVLYENLESLKQQVNFDFPSIPNIKNFNEGGKFERDKIWSLETAKQKPVPKTRTKVAVSKAGSVGIPKSNAFDAKHSYLESFDLYKCDKSDKLSDKNSQDFIFSLSKESNSSSASQSNNNYRRKNSPVAVENLVYCNVPLGEGKSLLTKHRVQPSDIQNKINVETGKNRMKNSYNLRTNPVKTTELQKPTISPGTGPKHAGSSLGKEKSKHNHNFSKSLEKLAEEIQFEPKKASAAAKSLPMDNYTKTKSVKMPKDGFEKEEKKGKTNDASVVLDENKIQSRSVFSRFRRSLHHSSSFKSNNFKKLGKSSKHKACELSLSWEGGLDKIQEKKENETKPQATPPGLQRSRTFMFAERSPLSIRPANKIFSVKHRLDTAYHSQRKPEEKVTLSTFKPILNIDVPIKPVDTTNKQIPTQCSSEKEKPIILEQFKTTAEAEEKKGADPKFKSDFEGSKIPKLTPGNYETAQKVYSSMGLLDLNTCKKTTEQKGLPFCSDNSESEDNLEEKSLAAVASKTYRSQSSMESNLTVSEASDSDENDSLDFRSDHGGPLSSDRVIHKRRTSLVRSSRVESSKARKVTARLPPTPPPEQKPLKNLGGGWGAYFTNGRSYYFNELTGEKNWKPPRKATNAQEKRLIGSHESLSSDINRSDTSSPLNENFQFSNSLNRSDGSLKSGTLDSAENSGSASCWKEGSQDDLNRSSYNSSPVAGLSQSSAYSFTKSSRDSLNRFSPIENVPSEEEGLELQDHVYQDEVFHSLKEDELKLEEEKKSRSSELIETVTHDGWEEFYDKYSNQIYYTYKGKKEKIIMWTDKLYFIPLNVSLWLQDIRKATEDDEEQLKTDKLHKISTSSDSIYDNVNFSTTDNQPPDFRKHAPSEIMAESHFHRKKNISDDSYSTWPIRKRQSGHSNGRSVKDLSELSGIESNREMGHFDLPNCTLSIVRGDVTRGRRSLGESRKQEREAPNLRASMSNLLASHRGKHTQECLWTWLSDEKIEITEEDDYSFIKILNNIENDNSYFERRIAFLNGKRGNYFKYRKSLPPRFGPLSKPNVNSIFDNEFVSEKPPVPPRRRKRKMNQNCSPVPRRMRKAHLAKAKPVALPTVRLKKISPVDANPGHSEKSFDDVLESSSASDDFANNESKKPLPFPAYNPELEYELSELLMIQKVTESSKERRRISTESKPSPILEESNYIFQGCIENILNAPRSPISMQSSWQSNEMSSELGEFVGDDMDAESRDKVKQFLEWRRKRLRCRTKPKVPLRLREDIIIDWENDYESLNEPVVLEGKSVAMKRFPGVCLRPKVLTIVESDCCSLGTSKDCSDDETFSVISEASQSKISEENLTKGSDSLEITDIVALYDKILKESDPKCDTETSDKISFSSVSEGLNSYSDFESDVNETIAGGEIWNGEKLSEENASVISWDVSEDASRSCAEDDVDDDSEGVTSWKLYTTKLEYKLEPASLISEAKLDTITEDDDKMTEESRPVGSDDRQKIAKVKSFSDTNLVKLSKPGVGEPLSKSVDFFRDPLTDDRLGEKLNSKKHDSITSDVCEWMAKIRGIAFAEDQLFSNDDEWVLSFDSEGKVYFFEETTKKSLWALPNYSREDKKPENTFPIQRSATESAINNETPTKLRTGKDGKQSRISASTRSSKAQSMLIEPKLDISPKDGSKTFSMPRDLSKIYGEIIRIGMLNKTKISENGKKLRKNWTPSFIVLTDSYLFFFKDAKSFQNMKNVIGPTGNHMCLSLQGAVIEKGDKISSRKNVYKISCSDNTDFLIQSDKSAEAEEWFKEISSVIQKLSQESTARGSPLPDSKSPSKVGRVKSLKVRSKDTGSMEDLSSTPEERQNKIKARLKKFFIRRPTVDSLKKKGIWKDEPVFGCSLEQITKNRNPRVPVFVEKCIECIESKEENMKTDGLYRASGNLSQVQKIRLEVDQNNLNIMKEEEDVHVLTGSLKLFFRELKEPLIPSKQLEPALLATDKHTRKERIKDFQKIVKSLPTPNYDTLKFLLQHLLRVKEYHKFNRMNINNLAIVFGPTLMWPEQESANMALELMQQNVVIECLLKEFQEIFT